MASDNDKPPYVYLRKGRWYWELPPSARKAHKRKTKPLGADQSAAWAMARKLNDELRDTPAGSAVPGTVAWLFQQFFKAVDKGLIELAPSTITDYKWLARRLNRTPIGLKSLGEINARSIKPRHVDLIYVTIREESGNSTAHYCCRFSRRVWAWAGRAEHVDMLNPWKDMRLKGLKQRDQMWTPEQVDIVIAKAHEMNYPSIALAVRLAYSFAHRKNDILSLTWDMLDEQERDTSKTSVRLPMVVESYPELHAALSAERARQAKAGLGSQYVVQCELTGRGWKAGRRWQVDTFSDHFRIVADAAGLPPELQYRDLRATAVTEIADAGTDAIARTTHSGHKTVSEDRHYSRRTAEQFKDAAQKRNAHKNKAKTSVGTAVGTSERPNFGTKKL